VAQDVAAILENWLLVLKALTPNLEKMTPLETANYHLTAGRASTARDLLEALAAGPDGLTLEAFRLLLKCYVALGLREEYRNAHKRFGGLFGADTPDFSRLNAYLKVVDASVFMLCGISPTGDPFSGTGFCIAPHLIITNRHVIEHLAPGSLRIIGRDAPCHVEKMEMDPVNDLALLQVKETLPPLRLGEFVFVEPGEQVLAIGFPSPGSDIHSENIYISKGIVNSIRKIEISPERVIFIDTKIGMGMSGGPLINDLGEVVGIVTLLTYMMRRDQAGTFLVQEQPVALPIHLARKYILNSASPAAGQPRP
jgi:molecular chaperone DnaK